MADRSYERIRDWSRDGRARLVEERGDEIRALLAVAFTTFFERHELGPFGFHDDEPMAQAVAWSVDRFRTADLDPRRLGEASFRIFTQPAFWLSQKVTVAGYRRVIRTPAGPPRTEPAAEEPSDSSPGTSLALREFGAGIARSLRQLAARTCADLVGYWLRATGRVRADWFGWTGDGEIASPAPSKKKRSFHAHDALFRFQCLHHALVDDGSAGAPTIAVRESMFRSCNNRPPYRRPDPEVAPLLPAGSVTGPRSVGMHRRAGLAVLVVRLVQRLELPAGSEHAGLERAFLRRSLSATTIHALDLERRPDVAERLAALARADELEGGG